MKTSIIILRLTITFIMALIFGLERQRSHKPIGFGTFIFVSAGSCALAIIAMDVDSTNPFPLLGAIVTGIGFLGAGALIRTTDKIFGFTTAASIWLFAILGLIIGLGQYRIGFNLYMIIWVVILFDQILAKKGIGSYQQKIVVCTNKIIDEKEIIAVLKENGVKKYKLITLEINKEKGELSSTFLIEGPKERIKKIHKTLLNVEWFESCQIGS
ncbi:MAG: MgtC/SapB family protein [Methanocellales archaeon]|nr:MgtC/SapB family protein [Methanocellales archaeon]MDD3291116.1 MgtC/SapB family protein [Methanocellales archaeon]MDD5235001.1 MgtC/SapB family protein [Methanocellales archaeon]MDD5484628.1 MgtC/SapB family protein [Methanocellales archaeon]